MIRKISHISIASLLLILTMGFTVSRHYCGGSLVDVSVMTGHLASCSDDGSACDMDGCCHNEQNIYQLNENYTSPLVVEHVAFFQIVLAEFAIPLSYNTQLAEESSLWVRSESPPPKEVKTVLSDLQVYRL